MVRVHLRRSRAQLHQLARLHRVRPLPRHLASLPSDVAQQRATFPAADRRLLGLGPRLGRATAVRLGPLHGRGVPGQFQQIIISVAGSGKMA